MLYRLIFSLLILLYFLVGASTTRAQNPTPLEVFVEHDKSADTATIEFISPVSGLSTPVTIQPFGRDLSVLQEMSLTSGGVLFQNPSDRRVMLATPDGRLVPHPFIPRQAAELVTVDWVLSPDGSSIAWVEVFASAEAWISNLYISDIQGQNIVQLPPPPRTRVNDPYRRARPLALTNDRQTLFYDAAAPVEIRQLTDYYADYEDLFMYSAETSTYAPLPGEPGCACGAGISMDGSRLMRLSSTGGGFTLHAWILGESPAETVIGPVSPAFAQAGDFFVTSDFALYTQAQNLETNAFDAQFALMLVDLRLNQQTILIGPSSQRLKVLSLADEGRTLLLGDVYGGGTYKLDLITNELTLVANQTWLGTLYLQQ
jgi:hypothetical protein